MIKMPDRHSPDDGDGVKRTLKEIAEGSRQIELLSMKCCTIPELFSPELIDKRTRLRDSCIRILLEFPKHHGRIIREKLWRHVYYDVIQRARRIQKDKEWKGVPLAYISQYLLNGVGHLNVVLMKLAELPDFNRSKFPFQPDGINNIINMKSCFTNMDDQDQGEPPKWLVDLIYIITINLGDLYRYLTDFYATWDEEESLVYFNRAKDYYSQAFVLYPDSGLSPNQVGNLSVKLNGGVDTTYYMLHSMLSKNAYEGSASNLRHHLSNVLVNFATQPATTEAKPMELFCNGFMKEIHNFLYETVNIVKFGKNIADLMTNFQERLATYDPDLDESLLFRISSICVLTFWQLQVQNSPNISLAVAFATAMFSQLITQLGMILEQHSHLQKEELVSISPTTLPTHNGDDNEVSGLNFKISNLKFDAEDNHRKDQEVQCKSEQKSNTTSSTTFAKKKKKSYLTYRRRPRTAKNMSGSDTEDEEGDHSDGSYDDADDKHTSDDHFYSTDEEESESEEEEESDFENDNEELADTGSDVPTKHKKIGMNGNVRAFNSASSSNCQSDTSGNSVNLNGGEKINGEEPPMLEFEKNSNEFNEDADNEAVSRGSERFIIGLEELQKCWSQLEPLLVAMLPFIRWLQISPEIKDAFSANCGKDYVTKMCDMFNLLGSQNWSKVMQGVNSKLKDDWKLLGVTEKAETKLFRNQLPEDRSMLGIPQYQPFVNDLNIENALNKNELLVTRIARVLLFGHWLVETKSFSMMYDGDEKRFVLATPKLIERRNRNTKLKKFMDGINSNPGGDALTQLYKASGVENYKGQQRRGKDRRDRNGKGGGRDRRRRGGNNHGRERERDRSKSSSKVVFVVVDLPAVLYHLNNLKKMANKRRFVVVVPHPVWKTIDEMKGSLDDGGEEALIASEWLEKCSRSGHRGVRCLRDHERTPIDYAYPKLIDQETSDFFLMMETCKYLLTHYDTEEKTTRKFFGDLRDKFRVIYLSGYVDLLAPVSTREFNPIAIARVVGTFVDIISSYPPGYGRRKWKSVQSNG